MKNPEAETLLGRTPAREFVGRDAEVERLGRLAGRNSRVRNAVLLSAPRSGKTELLRRTFDDLFFKRGEVAPVYYCLRSDRLTSLTLARDFLSQFLSQFIAFRSHDPGIVSSGGDSLDSVALRAAAPDAVWIRTVVDRVNQALRLGDEASALAAALAAPAVAADQTGLSLLIMLDDFHRVPAGDSLVSAEFNRALLGAPGTSVLRSGRPVHLLCGLRRVLLEMMPPDDQFFDGLESIRLSHPPDAMLERMIRAHAANLDVAISDSTVELMIQQLGRDLFYTRALVSAAASRESGLKTFMEFERVYTEEVIDGRIGQYLDAVLKELAPDSRSRQAAIEALGLVVEAESEVPVQVVIQRTGLAQSEAERLLAQLHSRELLELNFGFVKKEDDPVLWDYVRARYRDWIAGAARPLAGSELLGEKLKHSYRLMMSRYSRAVEAQLVELLSKFDFQSIPVIAFDASSFEKNYEGLGRVQAARQLEEEQERVRLPQIVFVSDLGYAELASCSARMFLASGFEGGVYSDSNEVVWLIALMTSKEPVETSMIETVARRMDVAFRGRVRQGIAGFPARSASLQSQTGPKIIRWYISKEGFTQAAGDAIAASPGYHSTFTQLDLAYDYILRVARESAPAEAASFELVIPIEDDAELIAARTVEQIARTADFDQESISQIKTALIEACLNAAEHSDSPDRKIYQKFTVTGDRLIVSVSSKGKQFSVQDSVAALAGTPKRGRGLQIIRALMDEVRFERTDDGSTLVMAKFVKRPESHT